MTGRRSSLCPRCGGVTYEQIDERHSRCADCGLRRTSQPLVLRPENDRASTENRRPDTRLVELAERMRGNFEKAGFPGYGLDDRWLGTRWFGGSGGSGNGIDRLELAHGENPWDPEDAQIRVERIRPRKVLHDEAQNIAVELELFTRQQVNKFWMSTGTLPDEVRRAAFEPVQAPRDPTAPWVDARIPIDGAAETFRVLACDDFWVAQARHDGMLVGIEARAWPLDQTGLVTVDDLSPYHVGSELIAERGRSRFGG